MISLHPHCSQYKQHSISTTGKAKFAGGLDQHSANPHSHAHVQVRPENTPSTSDPRPSKIRFSSHNEADSEQDPFAFWLNTVLPRLHKGYIFSAFLLTSYFRFGNKCLRSFFLHEEDGP